jgi:PAS domain S-box-containing protein
MEDTLTMKANHKIIALLVGAILLVALGVAASFWTFNQIDASAQKRTQTSGLIKKTNYLLTAVIDSETASRGYLLTGNEAFLEPYLTVRDSFSSRLEELRQLTALSATQKSIDALAPLVDAKLAHIARAVELYRNHDQIGAVAMVTSGDGQRMMDLVRAEISNIIKLEEDTLAQEQARFEANMRLLFVIILIASLFGLLLALAFAYQIYREKQQQIKDLVLSETQRILEIQTQTNQELQRANATLQVSEEKLAVTLNSIGDAVIATDAAGLVVLLNPLAEKLTGWTKAQAIGRPVDEIFRILNEETRQPAIVPVAETLALGTIHGLANHTVLIARDQSECSIADSCAPIRDREGLVVGAVLVFRDVTMRNRLDRALQEKNVELEKASQAKSDFLSSMSHELRSPLNAILGFSQLLETDSPPPTPLQSGNIAQILQAGWHLLNLINEVLDLAKIESGHASLSPEPVSISEVILECQGMIEPQAQERGIQLVFPRFDMPYFVRADRTRVKQVLLNLLSNAIKYNTQGGTVELKCGPSTRGHIRVSIRDTGAGLSPEQIAQLFQAFNRLGQEAGAVEGTGIGLVVAKRLIELMDGVIGVESSVGVGSVFWFELLLVGEPRLAHAPDNAALEVKLLTHPKALQHTLLYVEDNPANLKLVEQIIMRRPDICLLTAVNGTSGIELARYSQPDIILMDINLPDISGIEALKILHAGPLTARIPVIALSANAMPRDIKNGLEAGFLRYITKPIKINEFLQALDYALEFAEKQSADDLFAAPVKTDLVL